MNRWIMLSVFATLVLGASMSGCDQPAQNQGGWQPQQQPQQ